MSIFRECVIYDNKMCEECGDCNFCDLNPDKVCDDCGMCINTYDYNGIQVDDLVMEKDDVASSDYIEENWRFSDIENTGSDDNVLFIDDIEGLWEEIEGSDEYHHNCGHNHDLI